MMFFLLQLNVAESKHLQQSFIDKHAEHVDPTGNIRQTTSGRIEMKVTDNFSIVMDEEMFNQVQRDGSPRERYVPPPTRWVPGVISKGENVGTPFPLLRCLRTPKMHYITGFCIYNLENFPGLYRRTPASVSVLAPRHQYMRLARQRSHCSWFTKRRLVSIQGHGRLELFAQLKWNWN